MPYLHEIVEELEAAGTTQLLRILRKAQEHLERFLGPVKEAITVAPLELLSHDYVKIPALFFGMRYAMHVYCDACRLNAALHHLRSEGVQVIGSGQLENSAAYVLAAENLPKIT
jgi:hypothetical protein